MKVAEPPARRRKPKPGTSSSHTMCSSLPGGSAILLMLTLVSFMKIPFFKWRESCSLRPHYVRGAERTWTGQKTGKHMGSSVEQFPAVVCFPDSETFVV